VAEFHTTEDWVTLYQKAFAELQHAAMRGRIGEARAGIQARIEKLKTLPGLHTEEFNALDHALSTLRFLEREEDRYDENQRRKALENAARNLESIGPAIKKLGDPDLQ
jgi:hypothetical protein